MPDRLDRTQRNVALRFYRGSLGEPGPSHLTRNPSHLTRNRRNPVSHIPSFVFVHGIRLNRAAWVEVIDHLPPESVATAVDLPGHGSRRGQHFSFEAAGEVVLEAIDRVGGRAIVVGHSLGGYAAMASASREPERVAGLVVAGATYARHGPRPRRSSPRIACSRAGPTAVNGSAPVSCAPYFPAARPRRSRTPASRRR
ncbi:alpha/beta fold hydrolase [Agromyces laixinhei]|uniref:alpha/beta fold hydrolase n=1 Tax=Agromyces laixinhei TaxID=2585717 RepID=UPI003B84ADC0